MILVKTKLVLWSKLLAQWLSILSLWCAWVDDGCSSVCAHTDDRFHSAWTRSVRTEAPSMVHSWDSNFKGGSHPDAKGIVFVFLLVWMQKCKKWVTFCHSNWQAIETGDLHPRWGWVCCWCTKRQWSTVIAVFFPILHPCFKQLESISHHHSDVINSPVIWVSDRIPPLASLCAKFNLVPGWGNTSLIDDDQTNKCPTPKRGDHHHPVGCSSDTLFNFDFSLHQESLNWQMVDVDSLRSVNCEWHPFEWWCAHRSKLAITKAMSWVWNLCNCHSKLFQLHKMRMATTANTITGLVDESIPIAKPFGRMAGNQTRSDWKNTIPFWSSISPFKPEDNSLIGNTVLNTLMVNSKLTEVQTSQTDPEKCHLSHQVTFPAHLLTSVACRAPQNTEQMPEQAF